MSELIDCVFVSAEPFTELGRSDRSPQECFEFCLEVNIYAERVAEFGFRDQDMPKPLIHVHRVTELVLRSEPIDDLEDFLIEIKWSKVVVEETIEALVAIGADHHARFLATVHEHLMGLNYAIKRSKLASIRDVIANAADEHISVDALEQRYGKFGVSDEGDPDRWCSICLQAVRYMDGWTNIKRVPGGPTDAELKEYFNSRLEIARRSKEKGERSRSDVVTISDTKAFVLAAVDGDIEAMRNMLAAGADVNAAMTGGSASPTSGATALMAASTRGHLEVVRLLLASKANVNARRADDRATALILAAQEGHLEVVRVLLNAKAKINAKAAGAYTALVAAARMLHLDIVETLIAAGADVNVKSKSGRSALFSVCSRRIDQASLRGGSIGQPGHVKVARVLLAAGADVNVQTSEGWSPLIQASRDGLFDVVRELLAAGADVDLRTDYGFSALLLALSWNRLEIARLLLAAEADVHVVSKGGETTLMAASSDSFLDLVQTLLAAGVPVNAQDERGSSALMGAAADGHLEVVKALLAAGADVNARIKSGGRSALSLAAMNGHLDVVKVLVAAGADINVEDAEGCTPSMTAADKGHHEVERFLESFPPSETPGLN